MMIFIMGLHLAVGQEAPFLLVLGWTWCAIYGLGCVALTGCSALHVVKLG